MDNQMNSIFFHFNSDIRDQNQTFTHTKLVFEHEFTFLTPQTLRLDPENIYTELF